MKKVLMALSALIAFNSCKKETSEQICSLNMTSVAGTYKITKALYRASATDPEVDITNTYDACERDDIIVLHANGVLDYQDAGTPCIASYTSTWSLIGNSITLDGDPGTVESFDCSTLVAYVADGAVPGDKLTAFFTRQ
jgi:Lipocalin-like domain